MLCFKKTSSLCGCPGWQSCAGWLPCFLFWFFVWFVVLVFFLALAVLVGFDNYERSFVLAKKKRWFSCLLCNLCTQDDMQLTDGSASFYDLDKTLLYFLMCFTHLWNEEKTIFSPRWGEQCWCIRVLWDPWQGAIEINETPVVLLGSRCQRTLKEQPACISSWRTSKTPSNSEHRS